MKRGSLDDLSALIAVGREKSFTKAAAKLGVSQSALSQTIRQLVYRSNACFTRATFWRMAAAEAVQTNGLGLALCCSR